ncbi:PIG-L deacetylase family protein [Mycobacterium sp. HNNTM2301]|uniref:PIG-L deacetylase family protein n=1 Tax=Mycobacterium hainanense TaxID=3289775 RepID=UPI0035A6A64D
MNEHASPRRTPVLMAVHAHPDDESSQTGGTLARYAATGWRTVLITCTDGSQGDDAKGAKPGHPGHDPRRVAAHRSRELDAAAATLGIGDLIMLGYPDSGIPGEADPLPPPEAFSRRPLPTMVRELAGLLRAHRPDVLLTYPPNGFSGHPDHIRTHDLVSAALRTLSATPAFPAPQLHYIALSRSRLASLTRAARAALGPDVWLPPEEMAVDDADITTAIDITAYWETKLAALAAHASQSDAAALLRSFTAAGQHDSATHVEEYVRAGRPTGPGSTPEPGFRIRNHGRPIDG